MSLDLKISDGTEICLKGVLSTATAGIACATAWSEAMMTPCQGGIFGARLVFVYFSLKIPTYFAFQQPWIKDQLKLAEEYLKRLDRLMMIIQFATGIFVAMQMHKIQTGTPLSTYKLGLFVALSVISIMAVNKIFQTIKPISDKELSHGY